MSEPNERDKEVYTLLLSNRGRVEDLAAYREEIEAQRAPVMPEDEAMGFEFYWKIVFGWSQDMPRVGQKLSVHEMRTLTERLVSISAAALRSRQPSTGSDERKSILDRAIEAHGWERVKILLALDKPATRPSPQGEDDIAQGVENVIAWLDGHDITTRPRDALLLRDEVLRLRARLAIADSKEQSFRHAIADLQKALADAEARLSATADAGKEMREALEDIAKYAEFNEWRQASSRGTTTETSPLAVIVSKASAALERKETT